jgi:Mrp family chromosome partitioning ATPase
LPVLAEVPFAPKRIATEVLTATESDGPVAEAYGRLRIALMADIVALRQRANGQAPLPANVAPIALMVVSAGPGDGKSTTSANLAAAFADAGARVLVLSCDWHRPSIERLLRDGEDANLDHVPDDAEQLNGQVLTTTVPGVGVIPHMVGLDTAGQRAGASRRLVAMARELADVVIIDTAPMLATNDAAELAGFVDLLLLTARSGHTPTSAADRVRVLLNQVHAGVSGVVLVGAHAAPIGLRYYRYSRTYYQQNGSGRRFGRRKPNAPSTDPPASVGA